MIAASQRQLSIRDDIAIAADDEQNQGIPGKLEGLQSPVLRPAAHRYGQLDHLYLTAGKAVNAAYIAGPDEAQDAADHAVHRADSYVDAEGRGNLHVAALVHQHDGALGAQVLGVDGVYDVKLLIVAGGDHHIGIGKLLFLAEPFIGDVGVDHHGLGVLLGQALAVLVIALDDVDPALSHR